MCSTKAVVSMLYVVYDGEFIVFTNADEDLAREYAKDQSSVTGSNVRVAEYLFVYSDEVHPDDD